MWRQYFPVEVRIILGGKTLFTFCSLWVICVLLALVWFMDDNPWWLALPWAGLVVISSLIIPIWKFGRRFVLIGNHPQFFGVNGKLVVPREFIFDGDGYQRAVKPQTAVGALGVLLIILGAVIGSLDTDVGYYKWPLSVFWIFIPLWVKWVAWDMWRAKDAELVIDRGGFRICLKGEVDVSAARVEVSWAAVTSVDGVYYAAAGDMWDPCVRIYISGVWDFDSVSFSFSQLVHWDAERRCLYVSGRLFRSDPSEIINTMNLYRGIASGNSSDHMQVLNGEWPSQEDRRNLRVVNTERIKRGSLTV